jgi:acetyl-CoA/propionyl-CoA carboxylase biotin carboxyl carrier protein
LVEEAPAPFLTVEQERAIRDAARAICVESGYVGAGTVEFLVGSDGSVSFLEVNTRLQVEHPVTEQTTGIDLVLEQFRVAAGEHLSVTDDPEPIGHAFEFRINCEDPGRGFLPAPGTITRWVLPEGPGVRVDSGVEEGSVIGGQFDSLLAKLIVSGPDRATALARSRRALAEITVEGLPTVLPFHRAVTRARQFTADDGLFEVHTTWIESEVGPLVDSDHGSAEPGEGAEMVAILVGGRPHRVHVPGLATLGDLAETIRGQSADVASGLRASRVDSDEVVAPMQGTVVKVLVEVGQIVAEGDLVAVVEAMKMENPVRAHKAGLVLDVAVAVGETRAEGQAICRIGHDETAT